MSGIIALIESKKKEVKTHKWIQDFPEKLSRKFFAESLASVVDTFVVIISDYHESWLQNA